MMQIESDYSSLFRRLQYAFPLFLSLLLSACLGGGGGDAGSTGQTRDIRVSNVTLNISNDFQPANGKAAVNVTVVARGSGNIPVAGVPVILTSPSSAILFAAFEGITGTNGQFSTTASATRSGSFPVTAVAGGLSSETLNVSFIDPAADPRVASVSATVSNNFQRADGISQIRLSVSVRDSANIPLAGIPVSLNSSSPNALFAAYQGTTGSNGQFATTITSTKTENFDVTANAGGALSSPVTLSFIAPVQLIRLSSADYALPAGASAAVTVELFGGTSRFVDTSNIVFENYDLLPETPFSAAVSGGAEVLNVPAKTGADGRATFQIRDNNAENITLTVSSGTVSQTLDLYFGAQISLLPLNSNAVGDTTLTALLKDANNRPLVGRDLGFQFAAGNNKTLQPATAVTGADGTATVKVSDLDNSGGSVTVNAVAGQVSAPATVNFLNRLSSGSVLEVTPALAVQASGQTVTVSAKIKDGAGVPRSGQTIIFSVDGAALLNGSGNRVTLVTGIDGEARVQVSDSSRENVTLHVEAGNVSQNVPLYFGASLSMVPNTAEGIADGSSALAFTASLLDSAGAGIPGATLNFRSFSGSALLSDYQKISDANGRAKINVTNTVAESVQIIFSVGNLSSSAALAIFRFADAGVAASITLSASQTKLGLNGSATITALVLDSRGMPVPDGTQVNFTTSGAGTVTATAFTLGGNATATFNAATSAGLTGVTATVAENGLSDHLSIEIQSGSAGNIEVSGVNPAVIGIVGSGVTQTSVLSFLVKDRLGNLVQDGTVVNFSIGGTNLGGGESIFTADSGNGLNATGRTNNGIAQVSLKSGFVAGSVDVVASIGDTSTAARVSIVGGQPDADHLSLAARYLNIAGGVTLGLQDTITAFVADRFGNIIPDNTPVNFISEGGTIGTSIGGGAFSATTQFGQATAILQSAAPTTPNLAGVAPTGNVGLNRLVAYTTGSESFVDVNGNGVFDNGIDRFTDAGYIDNNGNRIWDMGEPITNQGDMSEPYIDANDSGTFESGELYIDVNRDNRFNGPDGIYQANTTVWESMTVMFSAGLDPALNIFCPSALPVTGFSIPNGSGLIFEVRGVQDAYGNALVSGSIYQVSTSGGVIGGTTDFTFPDTKVAGGSFFFSLASEPATVSVDANGNAVTTYPAPKDVTVTVRIKVPSRSQAPGGDGSNVERVFRGTVNALGGGQAVCR